MAYLGLTLKTNQNQSLAVVSKQGPLTQTALQSEACTKLPASCMHCLPTLFLPMSQPWRSSWNPVSVSRMEASRSNWSWAAISPINIFKDQSEQLYSGQSWQCLWTNQMQGFGVLICIRMDQSGTRIGTSIYISQFLISWGSVLSLSIEDWLLHFLAGAEIPKTSGQNRPG